MCENAFTQNKFVEFSPGLNVLFYITISFPYKLFALCLIGLLLLQSTLTLRTPCYNKHPDNMNSCSKLIPDENK